MGVDRVRARNREDSNPVRQDDVLAFAHDPKPSFLECIDCSAVGDAGNPDQRSDDLDLSNIRVGGLFVHD